MNKKKMSKRQRDIKSKLMAAIAMLLVSSIMMVSTTYAWFTLSTAPEVTGITTAVGANGNLEMALQRPDGNSSLIESNEGDSNKLPFEKNVTWGNLVDVSDPATYGLNNITLYPAALNVVGGKIDGKPLATPTYGADGRVATLEANTISGAFDMAKGQFIENANGVSLAKGVRAIGVSSSMTARQLAYRTAVANGSSFAGQAKTAAMQSLNSRGSNLASIAVKHALDNDATGYTAAEMGYLKSAVEDLVGADGKGGILGMLETALKNIMIADSIAPAAVTDDTYKAIVDGITAAADLTTAKSVSGAVVTAGMDNMIKLFEASKASVLEAKKTLDPLGEGAQWEDFSGALNKLLNTDKMTVNGMTISEISGDGTSDTDDKTGKDELVDKVIDAGFKATLEMKSGAGVYSDVADFCGKYSAAIEVMVSYGSIKDKNLPATMTALPTAEGTVYLEKYTPDTLSTEGGGDTVNPISEFYGYIIDLAFRTNAMDSYLQLQQTGIDRVYSDNTANDATMGAGATMSFTSTSSTFQPSQVKNLMSSLRIVFFDTDSSEIKMYAKLDMDKATASETGEITAPIALTGTANYDTILTDDASTADINESINIMQLDQNAVHELSVLVYLDGATVENEDVAADNAQSMKGSMNLQFSSSANLKPMEYSALRAEGGGETGMIAVTKVTAPEGFNASTAYYLSSTLAFQMTGDVGANRVWVSVDGNDYVEATAGEAMGGSVKGYTATIGGVTADSTVVIAVAETQPAKPSDTPAETPDEGDDTQTTTEYDVTVPAGVTGNAKATDGQDYTFTVDTTQYTLGEVTVAGTPVTPTDNGSGSYTIPAASVKGAIVINVTANTP